MRKIFKRYDSPPQPRCFPSSKKIDKSVHEKGTIIKFIISFHPGPLEIGKKLARKFMFNIFTKHLQFRCTSQNDQPTLKYEF